MGVHVHYKYVELHKEVKCKKSGENEKAKALWSLREAKDKGIDFYDLGSVKQIQTRLRSPTGAWQTHWNVQSKHAGWHHQQRANCEAIGVWRDMLLA